MIKINTRVKLGGLLMLLLVVVVLSLYAAIAQLMQQSGLKLSAVISLRYFFLAFVLIIISVVFFLYTLKRVLAPIAYLNEFLALMEKGILPNQIKRYSNDEIGDMADRLNNITQNLRNTAKYAHEIGEGNFDSDFKSLSEEDVLGHSLINMSLSLREADIRENERGWVINGVAELGEILRNNSKLEALTNDVIRYMIRNINAVQGAFYIYKEDEQQAGKGILELVDLYAYNRKKYQKKTFKLGEGLVGQAAAEQGIVFRIEIPSDYESISSGILGDKKPTCILIYPLIANEKLYGVIEFAGLHRFTSNEVKFVEEVSPIIARTIFNIQVNEQTQHHLESSQKMSSELRQQQEELREAAEKMTIAQEELQDSNEKLEEQVEEVNKSQKRMHSLLENASEVITIYDKNGRIRYVSPSVKRILGHDADELIGKEETAHIHEDNLADFKEIIRKLLVHSGQTFTFQYQYKNWSGEWIWLEATGKNLLNDPAVNGIVFNARDITLKRKAEIEERMRKNMQALSENSPDLITRISYEGEIAYVNPTIETYTGHKPEEFMNQSIQQLAIGNGIIEAWKEILNNVKTSNERLSVELNYSSPIGKRIMQVNAIPEYNNDAMESILVVSHDITEGKLIELEIQSKNKSINESINYSKRIQNAIIPDNNLVQSVFNEAFIMYKPRDVVSGDFPWFTQKGDEIFIAAVDCTGHGVPGAMLSLVGFFQLNNIVDSFHNETSASILDKFDQRVNATLIKDSNEENIKDGMDIAFCKINLKKKVVEFAGAHRPLYHITDGELIEYKGDKWAIGGGVYKNQTSFTNHRIKVKEGDSIFFFSDGLPDQFGGAENKKLGPSRIKNLLLEHRNNNLTDMNTVLDNELNAWKGAHKQTDDLLMIGIRF